MYSLFEYHRPRRQAGIYEVDITLHLARTERVEVYAFRNRHYHCGSCGLQRPSLIPWKVEQQEGFFEVFKAFFTPDRWPLDLKRTVHYYIDNFIVDDRIEIVVRDTTVPLVEQKSKHIATMKGMSHTALPFVDGGHDWGIISYTPLFLKDTDHSADPWGVLWKLPQPIPYEKFLLTKQKQALGNGTQVSEEGTPLRQLPPLR